MCIYAFRTIFGTDRDFTPNSINQQVLVKDRRCYYDVVTEIANIIPVNSDPQSATPPKLRQMSKNSAQCSCCIY